MTTSPREPDAGDRRIELKPSDASVIADFAARVRTALGSNVVDIRLFGSKMTGQDVPDSDIDILVVLGEVRPDVEDRIHEIRASQYLATKGLPLKSWLKPVDALGASSPRSSSGHRSG